MKPGRKDISDAFRDGMSEEEFARATVPIDPAASPAASEVGADEVGLPDPVCLLDVQPEPVAYAVQRLILARDITAIIGEGGSGKSTALLHLAAAIAAGMPAFNTFAPAKAGAVILALPEDGRNVTKNRIEAFCRGHHWDTNLVLSRMFLWDDAGVDLDDGLHIARIITEAKARQAVVIIFDPMVDLVGSAVEENSNTDARRINRALRTIIAQTGAAVVYAAHASKPAEGKARRDRFRGASAWINAVRLAWWCEPGDGGFQLIPIKANRTELGLPISIKRTIGSEDGLNWRAAQVAVDAAHEVTSPDVVTLLRILRDAKAPPNVRGAIQLLKEGSVRNKERADGAIWEARRQGWVEETGGPNRSILLRLSETGRARLSLSPEGVL